MKIFVTGATGYIGQGLTSRLLNEGHEVHALCRQQPSNSFDHPRFHFHRGDIGDHEAIFAAMKGCEVVFHVAGVARVWMRDPGRYYDVNVGGTLNVLDAALANNVRKVVFTSSAAVFGTSNGRPVEEDDIRTVNFFTDYETSKFIAEERILRYVRKGLDVVIVHPTRVYGPGSLSESNAVSQIIKLYLEGNWHIIPGNGRMIGNFSFIDDVVNGHVLAMEKGLAGEKYILGGINISFNEFFQMLKESSGKRYVTVHLPLPFMMFYAWQEELMANFPGYEPKITRRWVEKYNHNLACSSGKAVRDLGYTITRLEEGLAKTIGWLRGRLNVIY